MSPPRTQTVVEHATCLGCGCACDDITVVVRKGKIAETQNACTLGAAWFGDGRVPGVVRSKGRKVSLPVALAALAELCLSAKSLLVYLGLDLSSEAQREAIGLADLLGARLDSVTSDTVAESILAAQRRGRAGATLGEIRNRADVIVYWGCDPAERYPRYNSRYALDPVGTYVPEGRPGRTVIAVDLGAQRGPPDADLRLTVDPAGEIDALSLMRAIVAGREVQPDNPALQRVAETARRLMAAHYVVLVHDAEPSASLQPARTEGLIALAQALNGPTRCALSGLRAGGNRSGADAAMCSQTGYPFAVDFSRGYPRYLPHESAAALLQYRGVDTAVVIGNPRGMPAGVSAGLANCLSAVVGPRASDAPFPAQITIDTGIAGIHEAGTAVRMDDVPLALRPCLPSPLGMLEVLRSLIANLTAARTAATK